MGVTSVSCASQRTILQKTTTLRLSRSLSKTFFKASPACTRSSVGAHRRRNPSFSGLAAAHAWRHDGEWVDPARARGPLCPKVREAQGRGKQPRRSLDSRDTVVSWFCWESVRSVLSLAVLLVVQRPKQSKHRTIASKANTHTGQCADVQQWRRGEDSWQSAQRGLCAQL